MRDIKDFPLSELQNDRAESVADIQVCRLALLHGIIHHKDGSSVQGRIDTNQRIINTIDAELARRGEAP